MDFIACFDSVPYKNWPGLYFDWTVSTELNRNTGFDRLKIVELFEPVFLKLWEVRRKETFRTVTDFTLSHVLSRYSK